MQSNLFLTGIGQDSHQLQKAKKGEVLTLAGLPFAAGITTTANSDGDVILHALYNAISTALGGGSLSVVADPMCRRGITDSREYVRVVLARMSERGYRLGNVSVAIEGSAPRLEKYFPLMKNSLATLLSIEPEQIGLAATTGEGLTAFGQGEGLSCFVSVLLIHQ